MNSVNAEIKEQKIFTAICSIIGEIGAVGKNKRNEKQGFMYRGIDDVMNALQPMLAKYHVFVVPTVLEQSRSDRDTKTGGVSHLSIFKIRFTFYADDGSSVEAITVGESDDTGDKGSNKAMAIAFKYALFQVFCIPTEEMPDPDADTPAETASKQVKTEPKQAPVKQPTVPVDAKKGYINNILTLVYPDRTSTAWGKPNGFYYEPYVKVMKEHSAKIPTELPLDVLKKLLTEMTDMVPERIK